LETLVDPESEYTALDIALDIEGYADKPFIAGILIDAGAKFSAEEFDTLHGEFKIWISLESCGKTYYLRQEFAVYLL
jgi:hypothetical protein